MAAKKEKRVPASVSEKMVCNNTVSVPYGDSSELTIQYSIPFTRLQAIAQRIVDAVVSDGYNPDITEYLIRREIILAYSNAQLPEDVDRAFDVVFHTGLYAVVNTNASAQQTDILRKTVAAKIQYAVGMQQSYMLSVINDLAEKVSQIVDAVDPVFSDHNMIDVLNRLGNMNFSDKDLIEAVINR